MEKEHFGSLLREAREATSLTLEQVAAKTKIPPFSLSLLERGLVDDLPEEVFVRGFIRSYAKAVGTSDGPPLEIFDRTMATRRAQEAAAAAAPLSLSEEDALAPRRGIGLAVFVIIVLIIATITLGLFLRQPGQSGEGLSQAGSDTKNQPLLPSPEQFFG